MSQSSSSSLSSLRTECSFREDLMERWRHDPDIKFSSKLMLERYQAFSNQCDDVRKQLKLAEKNERKGWGFKEWGKAVLVAIFPGTDLRCFRQMEGKQRCCFVDAYLNEVYIRLTDVEFVPQSGF